MSLGEIDERHWLSYLVRGLRGKAAEACRELDYDTVDYDQVKERLRV